MASTRPAQVSRWSRTGAAAAPVRYAPVARPGTPGRWDRRSILDALAAWVSETGRAPRRQDWSGAPSEATGAARRKWMREHPRWPSSSCVRAHFGSWSEALLAADLPARRLTFETTVSERVAAARRLAADGLKPGAIAQALGVSRSSVHNYLHARGCSDCGGPVTNPTALRCAKCAASTPTTPRAWTRESVRSAIRDWRSERGRPPSYREWTPSRTRPGRWEAESPRWPSAAVVSGLYRGHPDPWNAALLDADMQLRHRRWSDDTARAALAAFWVQNGRAPEPADLLGQAWPGPHPLTLRRRYGSVTGAWRTLGPVPVGSGP